MNKWQQFCLQTMEIDRWVLQEKPKICCYILMQSLNILPLEKLLLTNMLKYKNVLVVGWALDQQTSERERVLNKAKNHAICEVRGAIMKSSICAQKLDFQHSASCNSSIPMWILDDNITTASLEAENTILKTMSLKNLLANPIDKKQVFEFLDGWQV